MPRSVRVGALSSGPVCPHPALGQPRVREARSPFRLAQVIDKDVKQSWARAQALQNTCSVTLVITDPGIVWAHTSGQVRCTAAMPAGIDVEVVARSR